MDVKTQRKYEVEVREWVETGVISNTLFNATDSMIRAAISKRHGYVFSTMLCDDMVNEVWIGLMLRSKQSYLDGEYKWSTFVYNTVKYTFYREYKRQCSLLVLKTHHSEIMLRFRRDVLQGDMSFEEFMYREVDTSGVKHLTKRAAIVVAITNTELLEPDTSEYFDCNMIISNYDTEKEIVKHEMEKEIIDLSLKLIRPLQIKKKQCDKNTYTYVTLNYIVPTILGYIRHTKSDCDRHHYVGYRRTISFILSKDVNFIKLVKEYHRYNMEGI